MGDISSALSSNFSFIDVAARQVGFLAFVFPRFPLSTRYAPGSLARSLSLTRFYPFPLATTLLSLLAE